MAKRLAPLVCVFVLFSLTQVSAQTGAVSVTTSAPASLVCDQTGTATVTVRTPSPDFELMLVMDESGSIDANSFLQLKNFMRSIVQSLNIGPNAARVGITMFSTNARLVLGLNSNSSTLLNTISGIAQLGGSTCIGCGIANADQHMESNARPGAARLMVVLTDGFNNVNTPLLPSIVNTAKTNGTTIFGVGVGNFNQAELDLIASDIPGVQTVFAVSSFNQLATIVSQLIAGLPAVNILNSRVNLTVSPEFTVTGALASAPGSTVTVTGNAIEWSIDLPLLTSQLSIDIRRSSTTTGSAPLISSFAYQDTAESGSTFQNATIALAGCDSGEMEDEIEVLQAQVASLTNQIAALQGQVAALTLENTGLLDQIADLQEENQALRQQLAGEPVAPTGTGAMTGTGQVVAGLMRNVFDLNVGKSADGNLKAALDFKICKQQEGQADSDLRCLARLHRLTVSFFTAVQFSNDAAFAPSPNPAKQNGVDTLVLAGVGQWDGVDGHRFTVTATDRGDGAGPNTDTFQIEITAADGTVVVSVTGALAVGNLEAS